MTVRSVEKVPPTCGTLIQWRITLELTNRGSQPVSLHDAILQLTAVPSLRSAQLCLGDDVVPTQVSAHGVSELVQDVGVDDTQ